MTRDPIKELLLDGESLRWRGQPVRAAYVMDSLGLAIFGLFWLVIPTGMLWVLQNQRLDPIAIAIGILLVPFFAAGLIMVAAPLRAALRAQRIFYAVTDQRVLVREDFGVRRVTAIPRVQVRSVSLKRQLGDRIFNVGTVEVDAGESVSQESGRRTIQLVAVEHADVALNAITGRG